MVRPDFYKLDEFTRAYVVAALWSSNDESTPAGGEPMDHNYDHTDIADDTLAAMAEDCRKFQADNGTLLERAYPLYVVTDGSSPQAYAGHDFWLTRNGHGAGFWDRKLENREFGDVGEQLTEAAKAFPEVNLYVGDDGNIYA
jgi:hypothetical protein